MLVQMPGSFAKALGMEQLSKNTMDMTATTAAEPRVTAY
jgi:hypothetical protein